MTDMTDAERYVREMWPQAVLRHAGVRQGSRDLLTWFVITRNWVSLEEVGKGSTEIAAWADAANRLEARKNAEAVQDLDSVKVFCQCGHSWKFHDSGSHVCILCPCNRWRVQTGGSSV